MNGRWDVGGKGEWDERRIRVRDVWRGLEELE